MDSLREKGIYTIKCSTPWAVGPTNCYLVERKEVLLIDTGIKTDETLSQFFQTLDSTGIRPERIRKIFITHGHTDHYGFANYLSKKTGAEIFIPRMEIPKVQKGFFERMKERIKEKRNLFLFMGIPENMLPLIEFIPEHNAQLSEPLEHCTPLEWGEVIDIGDEKIEVIPLPGHTHGHAGFFLKNEGILFTGDHLMPLLVFNPLYDMTQTGEIDTGILKKYESTLKLILNLNPKLIAPGHRKIIRNVEEVINKRQREIDGLREDLKRILSSSSPLSVFEATRMTHSNLQEWQMLFSFTQVLCILREYEMEGIAGSKEENGVLKFYAKI